MIIAFSTIELKEEIRCTHCAKPIFSNIAIQADVLSESFKGMVKYVFHPTDFCTEEIVEMSQDKHRKRS